MMRRIVLFLLDLIRPFYSLLRIDYKQLRAIVDVKLMMDDRRQTVRINRQQTESSNLFFWTLVIYFAFGIFISAAIATTPLFFGMTVFFTFLMIMIVVTLITDFSSILLDTSDNLIILPRPVDNRTFYAARLTHILLYLGQITLCLSLVPFVVVIFKYRLLALPFIAATVLTVIFAVFLTNSIYLLILRLASDEKVKTIINYFQIGMTIFFMGGYQIGIRMLSRIENTEILSSITWWSYLIPPMWPAGLMESLYLKQFDQPHMILTVLSVSVPLLSIYITNRWLTPFYNRKITMMGTNPVPAGSGSSSGSGALIKKVASIITRTRIEEGAFHFTYKMLARDNRIKLKIYPSFGLIIIFGFIFIFNDKEGIATVWKNLPESSYYILLIYLPFIVAQTTMNELAFSDDFKASWIYYSAPVQRPGEIIKGGAKAIFVTLFIPTYLIMSVFVFFVWKVSSLDDIVFGLINSYFIFLLAYQILEKKLPLSIAPNLRAQSGGLLRSMLMILCTGIPAVSHYLLSQKPLVLFSAIPLLLYLIYLLENYLSNTRWSDVKS